MLQRGTYTVTIYGEFPQPYFSGYRAGPSSNSRKLLSVDQWGDNKWQSMASAFLGTINLSINATDIPDLSQVTNMAMMFWYSGMNQDMNDWDVSSVSSMSGMFEFSQFNQNIDSWDTSSVTTMRNMFSGAVNFNQNLNGWNVSNVTDLSGMFTFTPMFNGEISNWNVSSTTLMNDMFSGAFAFNQDIST